MSPYLPLLLLILVGCTTPEPEPLKEHYLFLRCRIQKDCDESVRTMSEYLNCKLISGGKLDGVIHEVHECRKRLE